MANKWTKDQENAIYDKSGTLLISAAAGSGKTSVLVERVINKLIDTHSPVDADRLLIVTFSNAAAKEMKDRIYKKLSDLSKDENNRYALSRQMFLLESANISTIHAFCIRLLRQNFALLDLSPNFRIADEGEVAILKSMAINKVLEEYYRKDDPDFLNLVELVSSFRDDNDLIKTVFKLFSSVRAYPFFADWLSSKLSQYENSVDAPEQSVWAEVVFNYAEDAINHGITALNDAIDKMLEDELKDKYLPAFKEDLNMLNRAIECAKNSDLDGLYKTLVSYNFPSLYTPRGYQYPEIKEYVSAQRQFVRNIHSDLKKHVCTNSETLKQDIISLLPKIKKLFELTLQFSNTLFDMKKSRNILDFSDVEQLTLELLMKKDGDGYVPTDIAKSLRENFDEILIDEYQDTNAAQDMIFRAISKDENNMFMVGDVKQSIYQFRQAMPKLFVEKQNSFHPFDKRHYPALIHLSENFRSRYEVTSAINFFFSLLMSEKFGQVSYNESEALKCGATYPETSGYDTEVDIVSLKDSEYTQTQAQARHIAKRILEIKDSLTVTTKDGNTRPAMFSDFCILSRSPKNTASDYLNVLGQFGIPAYYDTSDGCLSSQEIATLLSVLKIVNNPTSDVDLITVLYSFIYNFNSDDLAKIRLIDRKEPLYKNIISLTKTNSDIKDKCLEFLNDITDFRRESSKLSLAEFIEYVLSKTQYRELVMARFDDEVKTSNLDLFKSYCADYDTRVGANLDSFLRYIDRLIAEGGNLPGVNKTNENSGAVKIMSIHHSKGLEFPFCFVTDLGKKFNKQDVNAKSVLHSELGFACVRRDEEKHLQYNTIPLCAVRLMIDETNLAEELRMLYVALTRAREKLILVFAEENPDNLVKNVLKSNPQALMTPYVLRHSSSFSRWILLSLLRNPASHVLEGAETLSFHSPAFQANLKVNICNVPSDNDFFDSCLDGEIFNDTDEEIKDYILKSLSYEYKFENSTKLFSKTSVTDLLNNDYIEPLKDFCVNDKKKLGGAEKGTAIHKFMQYCNYKAAKNDLKSEIKRLCTNKRLSEIESESIDYNALTNFFECDIADKILASDFVKREMKFTLVISADRLDKKASSEDEIIVQGIADCVYRDDNTIVVLDFKSDDVKDTQTLIDRYAEQLSLYKEAIEQTFNTSNVKRVIYSFKLSQAIWLD